jgi:hypothetical protein
VSSDLNLSCPAVSHISIVILSPLASTISYRWKQAPSVFDILSWKEPCSRTCIILVFPTSKLVSVYVFIQAISLLDFSSYYNYQTLNVLTSSTRRTGGMLSLALLQNLVPLLHTEKYPDSLCYARCHLLGYCTHTIFCLL